MLHICSGVTETQSTWKIKIEVKWTEVNCLIIEPACTVFVVVVVFNLINPHCGKCAAVFWLQTQRGSFPAPEGPNWSTWPWWCTVGSCHLKCSPRNFSPYILHCHSVQFSGPTGALHPITCPRSLIRSGHRHGFVLHSLSAKQICSIHISLLVFRVVLCYTCAVR